MDLTLLMMGFGALAASVAAALGFGVVVQVLVAVIVGVGLLAFVRPPIVRRLHRGPTLQPGPQALIGQSGLVLERVTSQTGRVKLRGEVWSARTFDDSVVVEPGYKVGVAEIDGATAVVYPIQ
jgi:membrane protein implicated in regulation of membrane protease activity